MADTVGRPVTNKVSASIIAQAAAAAQRQTTGATTTSTNTAGSGIAPTVMQVGAVTYYDPNAAMKILHDDAIARGIPGVPVYVMNTKSLTDPAAAQKMIDDYYAKIPKSYDVASALQTAHDQAVAKGIPGVPDVPKYNSVFVTEKVAQQAITNYLNSIPPTYDVNSAIKSIYDDAVAKGIPGVPAATTTTKVFVDKDEAQKIIDAYAKTIPPTYDVNSAIAAAHDNAVAAGIPNVPSATTTTKVFVDEKEAQLAIDAYTKTIPPTYDISTAMQSAHDAAVKAGIPGVPDVPKITQVYTDSKAAQEVVDSYTKSIPTVYDTTSALQAVHDAAIKQGIPNVPDVPKDSTVYTDSAKAQKVIDNYVNKINANITPTTTATTTATTTKSLVTPTGTTQSIAQTSEPAKQYVDTTVFTTLENIRYTESLPVGATTFDYAGQTFIIPKDASTIPSNDLAMINQNRRLSGQPEFTAAQYDVISGDYGNRKIQTTASKTIDPVKTTGYTFYMSLTNDEKEDYINAKDKNPSLTEYQFRQGLTGRVEGDKYLMTIPGAYTDVQRGTFGHSTVSAPIGSGDVKLAQLQQTKVTTNKDGSTGKAVVVDSKGVPVVKVASVAPITQSVNGVKTSATTTTLPVSVQAVNIKNGYTADGTAKAIISTTKVSTTGHVGQTQLPDGSWKDNAGATVDHTGQDLLKNGTWLDQEVKVGSGGTGTIKVERVTATPAQVAAAAKNIDKVFTLNSNGTASIKAGAKPTDADRVALDNAQYKLMSGTPTKPVTVAFGSSKVTGSYNPSIGSVTDPVARQKVIDAQIQAAANAKIYAEQVKANETLGKDPLTGKTYVIDASVKVGNGEGSLYDTKIVSPIFTTSADKNKFLADSKAAYEAFVGTGKSSKSQLTTKQKATVDSLSSQVNKDLSKASFLVQSSRDIEDATARRDELANKAKVVIASEMSKADVANANAYNAQIDQARTEFNERLPTASAINSSNQTYSSLDNQAIAKQAEIDKQAQVQEPLTDKIINGIESEAKNLLSAGGLIGVASAKPENRNEGAYVTDKSSALDKTLSYIIPQNTIKDVDAALGYAGKKLSDADKYFSGKLNLPSYESIAPSLKAAEMANPLLGPTILGSQIAGKSYEEFANTSMGKTVLGAKLGGVSAGDIVSTVSNVNNGVSKGVESFVKDQYTELKEKPVTFATENAALYGAGKVLGGLIKVGGASASALLGSKASGVAVEAAEKSAVDKILSGAGNYLTRGADVAFTLSAIGQEVSAAKQGYQKNGIAGATEAALDFTKNMGLATKGFGSTVEKVGSPVVIGMPTLQAQAPGKDLFSQASQLVGNAQEKLASLVGNTKNITASGLNSAGTFLIAHSNPKSQAAETGKQLQDFSKGDIVANAIDGAGAYVDLGLKGLNAADKQISEYTKMLPDSKTLAPYAGKVWNETPIGMQMDLIEKTIDQASLIAPKTGSVASLLGLEKSIISGVKQGGADFAASEYDTFREKPVTYAGELGLMFAGGEIAGAALKAGEIATSARILGIGEKLGKYGIPLAEDIGKVASKGTPLVMNTAMTAPLVGEAVNKVGEGYGEGGVAGATKAGLEFGKTFVIGGKGFSKGAEAVEGSKFFGGLQDGLYEPYKLSDVSPKITSSKISELKGGGSSMEPVDLSYGKTVLIGNKPLLTHVSGEGLRLRLGSAPAPEELLAGKITQSFAKSETPFFKSTVAARGGKTESSYLNSALNIAKAVSDVRKPLYTPETFEITSKAIPEAMRDTIKSSLISYDGDVMVAGSVPMKAQSSPFTTRTPHDLELYGDDPIVIVSHITSDLTKAGFKEGTDFQVNGSKVQFLVKDDKGKEFLDIGIEAFVHGENATPEAITAQQLELGSKDSSGNPITASKDKSEIAFGYESKKPVLVGNKEEGFIKTQNLAEQLTRKVAGSTQFHDNIIQPVHSGRIKDILDTTTSATAFAVVKKLPLEKDIVNFVNKSTEKFTPSEEDIQLAKTLEGKRAETLEEKKAAMNAAFGETVANDPVFSFIRENQRLPTLEEAPELAKVDVSDKTLLYSSKSAKAIETGNPLVDDLVNRGTPDSISGSKTGSPVPFVSSPSPSSMISPSTYQGSPKSTSIAPSTIPSVSSSTARFVSPNSSMPLTKNNGSPVASNSPITGSMISPSMRPSTSYDRSMLSSMVSPKISTRSSPSPSALISPSIFLNISITEVHKSEFTITIIDTKFTVTFIKSTFYETFFTSINASIFTSINASIFTIICAVK